MTDLQLSYKIGKALGMDIKRGTRRGDFTPDGVCLWYLLEHHGGAGTWRKLPNYCEDLNAMHKAEMWLRGTAQQQLNDKQRYDTWTEYQTYLIHYYGASATARERAKAFLLVLDRISEWQKTTNKNYD